MRFGGAGSSPLVREVGRGSSSASCVTCSTSPSPSLSHQGRGDGQSEQSECTFSNGILNCGENALEVISYLRVPKTQDTEALTDKKLVSGFITRIIQMLTAVGFNNDFVFKANKIENISINWFLPTKFCIQMFAAQILPQNSFFRCHGTSQFPGKVRQSHKYHYERAKGV
jgi:hypothetical protein